MSEKIRVNIYIDEYAWNELDKYIACSKSNWINEQILKRFHNTTTSQNLKDKSKR